MNDGENESKSSDVFGIKPFGEAIKIAAQGMVDGASAVLSRICLPAAEEFGLLLRDKVGLWRLTQAAKIIEKADKRLRSQPNFEHKHAHPRLVGAIVENGSWIDADDVQEMWAGLLASSCTEDGRDESNLMFINLLAQLTSSQARMLNYGCEHVPRDVVASGLVVTFEGVYVSRNELEKISGIDDFVRLDRELDHLKALGLLINAMSAEEFIPTRRVINPNGNVVEFIQPKPEDIIPENLKQADLAVTPLGLQMYVRCQGLNISPAEYFGLEYTERR